MLTQLYYTKLTFLIYKNKSIQAMLNCTNHRISTGIQNSWAITEMLQLYNAADTAYKLAIRTVEAASEQVQHITAINNVPTSTTL